MSHFIDLHDWIQSIDLLLAKFEDPEVILQKKTDTCLQNVEGI